MSCKVIESASLLSRCQVREACFFQGPPKHWVDSTAQHQVLQLLTQAFSHTFRRGRFQCPDFAPEISLLLDCSQFLEGTHDNPRQRNHLNRLYGFADQVEQPRMHSALPMFGTFRVGVQLLRPPAFAAAQLSHPNRLSPRQEWMFPA